MPSESAYSAPRRDALSAVYAALAVRGESLAGWARRRGHAVESTYQAVRRYAGRAEARPVGLATICILRDLRQDLGDDAGLLPRVPALRVIRS